MGSQHPMLVWPCTRASNFVFPDWFAVRLASLERRCIESAGVMAGERWNEMRASYTKNRPGQPCSCGGKSNLTRSGLQRDRCNSECACDVSAVTVILFAWGASK